ncbi:hypothetical protein A8G00_06955 [Sphingobium sp. SA916]|nr:hypothetical protein A8G00_06955 [Sphingobium sp. SA916]
MTIQPLQIFSPPDTRDEARQEMRISFAAFPTVARKAASAEMLQDAWGLRSGRGEFPHILECDGIPGHGGVLRQ